MNCKWNNKIKRCRCTYLLFHWSKGKCTA